MKIKALLLNSVCVLSLVLAGCSGGSNPSSSPTAKPTMSGTPTAAATSAPAVQPAKLLMGGADIESVTVSENFDTVNNPRLKAGGYVGSIEKDKWKQFGPGQADQPMTFGRGYSKRSVSEFESSSFTIKFKDGREVVVNLPAYTIDTEGKWSAGGMELADDKMYIGETGAVYADVEGTKAIPVDAPSASATPSASPSP